MNNDLIEFGKVLIQWGAYTILYGIGTMLLGVLMILAGRVCFPKQLYQLLNYLENYFSKI